MMNEEKLRDFVEFCASMISNETVGSRYESTDVKRLWKLGDFIIGEIKQLNISVLLPKLKELHDQKGVRYDDRLYRASIIFRKYWEDETGYLETIKKLNVWTKLRELYPICDGLLTGKVNYTRKDVDKLVDRCKNLTYLEVREEFKKFRRKDDKILAELGIDKYEVNDLLIELQEDLRSILEKGEVQTEETLRKIYSKEYFQRLRLLLSALQKEDVYLKYQTRVKEAVGENPHDTDHPIAKNINCLFVLLSKFVTNNRARSIIRDGIPLAFIGELSTYLRAMESEENKKQYLRNKDILNQFIKKFKT